MRLLLDTHIAIWAVSDPPRLSGQVRKLIAAAQGDVFVSAASIWEIGIKFELGRKSSPSFSAEGATEAFGAAGFDTLDIKMTDIFMATTLRRLHADPFDRMIIAHALGSGLRLVTYDTQLAAYSDATILMT